MFTKSVLTLTYVFCTLFTEARALQVESSQISFFLTSKEPGFNSQAECNCDYSKAGFKTATTTEMEQALSNTTPIQSVESIDNSRILVNFISPSQSDSSNIVIEFTEDDAMQTALQNLMDDTYKKTLVVDLNTPYAVKGSYIVVRSQDTYLTTNEGQIFALEDSLTQIYLKRVSKNSKRLKEKYQPVFEYLMNPFPMIP